MRPLPMHRGRRCSPSERFVCSTPANDDLLLEKKRIAVMATLPRLLLAGLLASVVHAGPGAGHAGGVGLMARLGLQLLRHGGVVEQQGAQLVLEIATAPRDSEVAVAKAEQAITFFSGSDEVVALEACGFHPEIYEPGEQPYWIRREGSLVAQALA